MDKQALGPTELIRQLAGKAATKSILQSPSKIIPMSQVRGLTRSNLRALVRNLRTMTPGGRSKYLRTQSARFGIPMSGRQKMLGRMAEAKEYVGGKAKDVAGALKRNPGKVMLAGAGAGTGVGMAMDKKSAETGGIDKLVANIQALAAKYPGITEAVTDYGIPALIGAGAGGTLAGKGGRGKGALTGAGLGLGYGLLKRHLAGQPLFPDVLKKAEAEGDDVLLDRTLVWIQRREQRG
jgi:hypothetical protein